MKSKILMLLLLLSVATPALADSPQLWLSQSPPAPASPNPLDAVGAAAVARSKGAIKVDNLTQVGEYVLVSTLLGDNGGRELYQLQRNRWRLIQAWSGVIDSTDLVTVGVSKAVADQMIVQQPSDHTSASRQLQTFREAWSKSNPDIAPFLGYWAVSAVGNQGNRPEISFLIFPTATPDRVCVVGLGRDFQSVSQGKVSGNALSTETDLFLRPTETQTGDYSLMRAIPGTDTAYRNSDDRQSLYAASPLNTWDFSKETQQKLSNFGCVTGLPPSASR
jgi:hypothetical protein